MESMLRTISPEAVRAAFRKANRTVPATVLIRRHPNGAVSVYHEFLKVDRYLVRLCGAGRHQEYATQAAVPPEETLLVGEGEKPAE